MRSQGCQRRASVSFTSSSLARVHGGEADALDPSADLHVAELGTGAIRVLVHARPPRATVAAAASTS
jgi:hypothetical protein